jgi:small subunit ribosomal protein S2
MALPEFTMRQLLEAGVHFGHQTQRWNPRMSEFIYGERNGIHIIDLTQTVPMLDAALNAIREIVAKNGRILFVGTKRQAQKPIAEAAEKCAQYYMNHRWLGGTLTNWKTVSQSIKRLNEIDEQMADGAEGLTKKERLGIEREQSKLQASLGGIREMGGVPDLLFVIDVNKEDLAVAEARKLGIPVVAVVDTNCRPDGIDYIIPGNDDASRAVALYCDLVSRAALDGMSAQLGAAGIDLGEMETAVEETALDAEASAPATEDASDAVSVAAKTTQTEEAKADDATNDGKTPSAEKEEPLVKETPAQKAPEQEAVKGADAPEGTPEKDTDAVEGQASAKTVAAKATATQDATAKKDASAKTATAGTEKPEAKGTAEPKKPANIEKAG